MVLRAVLSAQADKVSQALGMRSGVEMRAARHAAERIGAQIVLGGSPGPPRKPCVGECSTSSCDPALRHGATAARHVQQCQSLRW